MARKSRVRRQIKSRRTQRRRRLVGGTKQPIANVQFNNNADSLSQNIFGMVLKFNNGNVKYGDIKIGTYKDNIVDGYYTVEPFKPNVHLYGRQLTDVELKAHGLTETHHAAPKTTKSSYYSKMKSALITPRSSSGSRYSTFSSSASSSIQKSGS